MKLLVFSTKTPPIKWNNKINYQAVEFSVSKDAIYQKHLFPMLSHHPVNLLSDLNGLKLIEILLINDFQTQQQQRRHPFDRFAIFDAFLVSNCGSYKNNLMHLKADLILGRVRRVYVFHLESFDCRKR